LTFAALVVLAPESADAQTVSNSYSFIRSNYTSLCWAETAAKQPLLGGGYFGALINSSATDSITVHCPIIKTTSGPSVTGDDFYSAQIPVLTNPNHDTISCNVDVVRASAQSYTDYNVVERWFGYRNTDGVITLGPQGTTNGLTRYWNAGSQSPANDWYYLELVCTLPPKAQLGTPPYTTWAQYTITERGTNQPQRIYSPSSCKFDPANGNTTSWSYIREYGSYGYGPGGYIYANRADGPFRVDCPVPNGMKVQVAIAPTIGSNTMGCNLDNADLTTSIAWPTVMHGTGLSLPMEVIPLPGYPDIVVPSTGTHQLVCGYQFGGNGDGNLGGYRATP
jgi:hypothetical protein